VSGPESVSESELFFGFGSSQNFRILLDSDSDSSSVPQHYYKDYSYALFHLIVTVPVLSLPSAWFYDIWTFLNPFFKKIHLCEGDKDFVDVTLGTEGRKLPAHKMLLSACSPYFRELLKVGTADYQPVGCTHRQCCGSESEVIRMFWLDPNPNPKKSSDTDSESDSDTVVGWKFFVKNQKSNTWRRKKFFYWKFVFSDVQVSEHIWKQLEATLRKIWGQNISLKNLNPKKIICGSESDSEKKSSDPQHCTQGHDRVFFVITTGTRYPTGYRYYILLARLSWLSNAVSVIKSRKNLFPFFMAESGCVLIEIFKKSF
jgi:hypothetical protein